MPTELQRISTFATAAEKQRIQRDAEMCGLSVSRFVLFAAIDALPQPEQQAELFFDLIFQTKQLEKALKNISGNLKAARKSKHVPLAVETEIKQAAAAVSEFIKQAAEKF
jgi:uncharacterized protein (DUF1778 family)